MAKVAAPKVASSGTDYTPHQVTRILKGLYGGLFAWYSLPKIYARFNAPGEEEKFYVGFVITHDRMNRELPNYSEAMIGIRPKLFYSAESGMKSSYVGLLYALLGGKKSLEEIADMETDDLPDLDEKIGNPVTLFIEPSVQPDKNGLYTNRIKGLEPADKDFLKVVGPLWKSKIVEVGEKGTARLVTPCAAYEDDVEPADNRDVDELFGGQLESEIPF